MDSRQDWYPTFSWLAGVSGRDDAPIKPLPIDPTDPTKDIYQNFTSFPSVDGVNLWPFLIENMEISSCCMSSSFTIAAIMIAGFASGVSFADHIE